jgi:predicted transcriptional regulator
MIATVTLSPNDADAKTFIAAVKGERASADAGRAVPYEDVRKWLLSWRAENELPKPECR